MKRPRIGVFKFTSCDGCLLGILNLEEEFLRLADLFRIDYFPEATDRPLRGRFDIAIIEGSITTPLQKEEIINTRERARYLITVGACATSGGIQALRNWMVLESLKGYVYPDPQSIESLSISTPISDHVYVDYEIWGCPVTTSSVSEVLASFLIEKRPALPQYSLCMECKRVPLPCILVAGGEPCLGPITRAGCDALCPSFSHACYGCFGPRDGANIESLLNKFRESGLSQRNCTKLLDRMNTYTYRRERIEKKD